MRYGYRLDSGLRIADPASRLQDGDIHDASVVTDTGAYAWRNDDWRGLPWTDTVLYEIHPGLAGGFRGVQERLADLAELGVTAIELMPIGDFPGARNWGYDGVLPYAPDCAYGSPDELRLLIDTAHGMGLQVFLDVVYNHFGPEGNYLAAYASGFFDHDLSTPWGAAIDFSQPQVRAFFAENALYWLQEFRFDGLRLDAAHAISDRGWLVDMARFVRSHVDPGRHVHLVLEHEGNASSLLRQGFDAQWNDDAHHVLHHILTGETDGYYAAYADDPTGKLARCLAEGFVYQGQASIAHAGRARGEPSTGLPPTAFVFFLQNHDQTGNRAQGERLLTLCKDREQKLKAAIVLQLLTPHIPLIFMGEECGSTAPFLYFTSFLDAGLQENVADGRRKEFAAFQSFSGPVPEAPIPDPGSMQTWAAAQVEPDQQDLQARRWRAWYKQLLDLRRRFISPFLGDAAIVSVDIAGTLAVQACWRLEKQTLLGIHTNLSDQDIALQTKIPSSEMIVFASRDKADDALRHGTLLAGSSVVTIATGGDRAQIAEERGAA